MTPVALKTIIVLPSVIAAFSMVWWIYFKILRLAKEKGLVDNPGIRKLQRAPVPVMGGLAVFAGIISGFFVALAICGIIGFPCNSITTILPVIIAMNIMLYIGALDDMIGLSARSRVIIESLAILGIIYGSGSCLDSLHGIWGIEEFSW